MTKQSAEEMREQRRYIGAHEAKIRRRLRDGETYTEVSADLGVSIRVLRHMLEVVLTEFGVHKCSACLTATTRNAPHSVGHG